MQIDQRKLLVAVGGIGLTVVAAQLARTKMAHANAPGLGTVTIGRPREVVFACLQDAEIWQFTLGGLGALQQTECVGHRDGEILAWERSGKARSMAALKDAPRNRGTEVHMTVRGSSKEEIKAALRRVKAVLEAGEVPTGERA